MYLTASSLRDFLTCPEKFKFGHILKLRKKIPKAILAFGTVIHASIAKRFIEKIPASETFKQIWSFEDETLYEFSNGDSHEILLIQGESLLKEWEKHPETQKLDAESIEQSRYVEIAGVVPFYSTIDFTGENGKLLLDWKTAVSKYPEHKAKLDLQLTAYAYVLGETEKLPEKVGFGVLIKKKTPEIQYLFSERTTEDLKNFEKLVLNVWEQVKNEKFFKVPGFHCSWCDFLPLCLNEPDAEEQFIITSDRYLEESAA